MADAAGPEPDEDLALAGWIQLDILDDERLGELLEYGGADPHGGGTLTRFGRARLGT